jgi:hypothetical protein
MSGSIWKGSRRSWQSQQQPSRPLTILAVIVVYSTSGAVSEHGSLPSYDATPWRAVERKPLAGALSLLVAETAA